MGRRLFGITACVIIAAAACQTSAPSATLGEANQPGASASASPSPDANLAARQTLRINIGAEPSSLDPTLGAADVLRALQRPLVDVNAQGEIVPALAESFDVSDDAKTLTFHLREARYSNGDPIVASDFVYSARRLADPRTAAPYGYVMGRVIGGPQLLAMAGADPAPSDAAIDDALARLGVSAPDDKTFVIQLIQPASFFLNELTLWFFVPIQESWITRPDATEAGSFVSSGPFVLDTWQHESLIVLKPNPNWWGDRQPTLTEIRMSMSDPSAAFLAYEADELDMVKVPIEDIQRVKADPALAGEYREVTNLAINFYSFASSQDRTALAPNAPRPTTNKDFRIALTQAIDKQALIDATYGGLGKVANSVIMPGIPGHQPDLNPYPFDLASATQHMDAALRELGVESASELRPKLGFITGFDNEPRVSFLAEAWRQAFGLDVEETGSELAVFFDELATGVYDIAFNGWAADYPHAVNQLDGLFTCGGGNNAARYCNPDFDALLVEAAKEQDPDRQVATYREAQTLLMQDAPILPLRFPVTPYAVKPYVSGITSMPMDARVPGDYYFETVQILKH